MAKTLEQNLDKVSQEVTEVVEDVKETMNDVTGWRSKTSVEDKVTTVLGLIVIIVGLCMAGLSILSSRLFRGVVLVIFGFLTLSGYFHKRLKPLFEPTSPKKAKKADPVPTVTTRKSATSRGKKVAPKKKK